MLHHRIACVFQHRAAIYANYAYFQWFDSSLLKFQSLNLNLCLQAASYWIVTSIESLCLPKKVLPQILAFIQTPNTKNIPSIFGKYCSDMRRKELRNGYKISDLDIYANIHECTKLHKHKLIQGRHSLRNAAPKCSLRSPMSRNVCFKHVQHPMKSVLSNFNYHSSQTSNEILPLKLQSNILHPMRILLSFALTVLAQIT